MGDCSLDQGGISTVDEKYRSRCNEMTGFADEKKRGVKGIDLGSWKDGVTIHRGEEVCKKNSVRGRLGAQFEMPFRHLCKGVAWGAEDMNLKFRGGVQCGGSSGLGRWAGKAKGEFSFYGVIDFSVFVDRDDPVEKEKCDCGEESLEQCHQVGKKERELEGKRKVAF